MKDFFAANIMRTAICVVLLSLLPAIFIVVGAGVARYTDELTEAEAWGERFVRPAALRQTRITQAMETFALALGRLGAADMAAGSLPLRDLLATSPEYANLLLLDTAGNVLSSALPVEQNLKFSNAPFFNDVVSSHIFSVGKTVFFSAARKPVLYSGAPVTLNGVEGAGVLCIALNLSWDEKDFAGQMPPEDAALFLVDGAGTIALAYPGGGPAGAGEKLEQTIRDAVAQAVDSVGRLTVRQNGHSHGVDVTYQKLSLPHSGSPYCSIVYTQPGQFTHARARDALYHEIGLFAAGIFLALALAVGLCYITVRRPWEALLGAAARIGGGELGVRVPENGVGGEIGMLCREFNAMADSLDKHERELAVAQNQTECSRIAKSEFLANMSHEIRTSMNAILGLAYLVLKTDLTVQQRGYITKLLTAANSLLRVVSDILDFSKIEAGEMVMEDISFSLRRVLGSVRSETAARLDERQLGFALQISPDVPDHLIGDPLRLGQALMVLVDDAVSRSERGTLSLACSVAEQNAEQVTLLFAVRDAGVGLTPAQLVAMHEFFTHETQNPPATPDKASLRLAIANRLFRMMRGRVDVVSVFGEGALFTARARFGYAVSELRQSDRFFKGKKALVVDRSEVSRQDLVDMLTLFGFTVVCVPDVSQAAKTLSTAENSGSPIAIVFMDWRPSITDTGSQVTQLRKLPLSSPPPLVLTTASARADLPVSLGEVEIDALLPKPINESLVFDTVMNLLGVELPMETDGTEKPVLAGLRVLLVEDNAVNQQVAGKILANEGARFTCAGNGAEAVALLAKSAPGAFDLVLMDLQMPVMDGFAATREIRKTDSCHPLRLPVIAMTAHSDSAEIAACFDAGMNDHTGKPIIVDTFLRTIRHWLPPRAEDAAALAEAIPLLRALSGKGDAASQHDLDTLVRHVAPLLHEGRTGILRTALLEGDAATAHRAAAAFEALVADLTGGDGA